MASSGAGISGLLLCLGNDDKRGAGQGVVDHHHIESAGDHGEDPAEVPALVALLLQFVERLALPVLQRLAGVERSNAVLLSRQPLRPTFLRALFWSVDLGADSIPVFIRNALIVAEEGSNLSILIVGRVLNDSRPGSDADEELGSEL